MSGKKTMGKKVLRISPLALALTGAWGISLLAAIARQSTPTPITRTDQVVLPEVFVSGQYEAQVERYGGATASDVLRHFPGMSFTMRGLNIRMTSPQQAKPIPADEPQLAEDPNQVHEEMRLVC